jgi:glycine oxidase
VKREPEAVAIVGGGIIGLSIAWRAAQNGYTVTVFDQAKVGGEASWAGAGMLAPGGEIEGDSAFSRQLIAARAQYPAFLRELAAESGRDIEFQGNGALDLAYSDEERSELIARTELHNSLGIASKPVSIEHVRAFWPRIRMAGLVAARFVPGDAVVNPRDVTAALRIACERRAVSVRENTKVDRLSIANDGACLQDQRFDSVVIAAGAWSSQIQVDGVPALPASEPVRGHLIGYQQPADTLSTIVRSRDVYLLQRSGSLLIAGASTEHVGFSREIDTHVVRALESAAESVLPHLGETTPTEFWNGFRPGAQELHVGTWHLPNLLLAYGHYRNGILLAPLTAGQVAAEL